MKPRRTETSQASFYRLLPLTACLLSLPFSIEAELVAREGAGISLVNDSLTAATGEPSNLAVISNDSISGAGNFLIAVSGTTDQGGSVVVDGNSIVYTPPASLQIGDSDSFSYTVTEEDWRGSDSDSWTVLSADMSGLDNTFVDPGNGGTYVISNAPGFNSSAWDGVQFSSADINGFIDKSSLYRHAIEPDLSEDIAACNPGSDASVDVSVNWNLTKTAGSAAGYEASIARALEFPLADNFTGETFFVREDNWPAGDTRDLRLTLDGLTPAEVNALQFGLWAQDAQSDAPGDDNDWLSNTATIDYTIDTTACPLASASATVSISLGAPADSDGDSILDRDDLDDDNDGVSDALEQDSGADIDSDGDGIVDRVDLDSDNDGILDIQESGAPNLDSLDTDRDGRIDGVVGANGLADVVETGADSGTPGYELADTDGDGTPDIRDLDSDNDSVVDLFEAGGTESIDGDGNGRIDGAVGSDGLPDALQPGGDGSGYDLDGDGSSDTGPDTDEDGDPDFRDLDSDGDGINDIIEAGGDDTEPAGGDGVVDAFSDADGDGLDDAVAATPLVLADADADGIPNFQDTDSDNDGRDDSVEGNVDADGNNVPDYLQENPRIETGLSGGGCSLVGHAGADPTLPLLVLISLVILFRRNYTF